MWPSIEEPLTETMAWAADSWELNLNTQQLDKWKSHLDKCLFTKDKKINNNLKKTRSHRDQKGQMLSVRTETLLCIQLQQKPEKPVLGLI